MTLALRDVTENFEFAFEQPTSRSYSLRQAETQLEAFHLSSVFSPEHSRTVAVEALVIEHFRREQLELLIDQAFGAADLPRRRHVAELNTCRHMPEQDVARAARSLEGPTRLNLTPPPPAHHYSARVR